MRALNEGAITVDRKVDVPRRSAEAIVSLCWEIFGEIRLFVSENRVLGATRSFGQKSARESLDVNWFPGRVPSDLTNVTLP